MSAATPALPAPPGSAAPQRGAPRWGVQTGLFQPRRLAFWLFAVALVMGGLYFLLLQVASLLISPVGLGLSWILLLFYIVPVVLVVRWLDLYEREPRSLLIAAFLWGGLVGPLFAGFANDAWGVFISRAIGPEFAANWSAALTAPVVEEVYKYLGVVLLFLIAPFEFDDLIDGFVYGALVGLGFAVVEDIFYFMFIFGGDVGSVIQGFLLRVVASGLYGHVTFTGISGIGLAYFVTRRFDTSLVRRLAVAAGLLLLAMLAHFIWNSPLLDDLDILLYGAIKGLPFLIGLVVLLVLARRREHVALAEVLAPELGRGGVTRSELAILSDRHARQTAEAGLARAGGGQAKQLLRNLRREQVRLALVASAADSTDDARVVQQRAVCAAIRARLLQAPGADEALGLTPEDAAVTATLGAPFAADSQVAASGAWAWTLPDQANPQRMPLAPRLALQVVERRGDWLLVRSQSGWFGWTGAPYLEPRQP